MSEHTSGREPATPLPAIAGYRLLRVLGHGGMSTVYLAQQLSLGREVAIKVMLPSALADEVSRRRFEAETRTIARLEHPHIVGIFQVGRTSQDLPYYAMPHLARGHLGQRDMREDPTRVRSILAALLSALDYAHSRGVVHRDVKAENVLFDESERPLLADFGIALHRGFGPRVTTAGLAVGSTAYMAPEQARGEEVDRRVDLYSVGVLAWEMVTGQLPFNAADALSMAVMHAQDPIPRLPASLRHWQRFFDKALAKSPDKRFATAAQMLEALERVPHRQPARASGGRERVRRGLAGLRRWPKGAWVGLFLVAAALAGMLLRQGEAPGGDGFFRDAAVADTRVLPSPDAGAANGVLGGDPTDAMLRAAPESAAERWVAEAERQIRQRNLTSPKGNNAFDSLVAAAETDQAHVRLPAAVAALVTAFAAEAETRLRNGEVERARRYVEQAQDIATRTGQPDSPAMADLRRRLGSGIAAQVDRAAARYDRDGAVAAARLHAALGLDKRAGAALLARAQAVPGAGDRVPGDGSGAVLVKANGRLLFATPQEVSRADFARFASATRRPAALCRERGSLLRIVKPRSWQSPGFEQAPAHPVVCVSFEDANAYARWLGNQGGKRYRLPTATEAGQVPQGTPGKAVAEWSSDCSGGCTARMVVGQSWREGAGSRVLEGNRGYDDVGFRLVREP